MINRRQFVKTTVGVSALPVITPMTIHAKSKASSDVYELYNKDMVTGKDALMSKVNESVVIKSMEALIKKISNESNLGKAWQKQFPGITLSKKIGIKLNIYSKGPQFALIKAIVLGLKSMFDGQYPGSNIWVFENNMNFTVNEYYKGGNAEKIKYNLDGLGVKTSAPHYKSPTIKVKSANFYVAEALADADYGISLAGSRVHSWSPSGAGGLTGVIKNMMGAVSTSKTSYSGGNNFHGGQNGFVDLFKNYMQDKLVLYIADHILIPRSEHKRYHGFEKVEKRILLSKDPCAIDSRSVEIIKKHYSDPTKIVPQALEKAGLGSTAYKLIPVELSSTIKKQSSNHDKKSQVLTLQIQSKTSKQSKIQIALPSPLSAYNYSIYSLKGNHIKTLTSVDTGLTITWNKTDNNGRLAPSGKYILKASSRTFTKTIQFHVL